MRTALIIVLSSFCIAPVAIARTWSFDPAMLEGGGTADVSLFNQGLQLPGVYTVDIYLNADKIDSQDVAFTLRKDEAGKSFLYPCISPETLSAWGVKTEDFPALSSGDGCVRLSAIPQATFDFRFEKQALAISIPQLYLRPKEQGIAPRQLWNDGIPAFLMNYSANTIRTENRYGDDDDHYQSSYVQLNPGANLGPWRLRNQTNWQRQGLSPDAGRRCIRMLSGVSMP